MMSWSYLGIGKGKKFLKWGCLEYPAYTPPESQIKKRWMDGWLDDNICVYGWVIGRTWSSLWRMSDGCCSNTDSQSLSQHSSITIRSLNSIYEVFIFYQNVAGDLWNRGKTNQEGFKLRCLLHHIEFNPWIILLTALQSCNLKQNNVFFL